MFIMFYWWHSWSLNVVSWEEHDKLFLSIWNPNLDKPQKMVTSQLYGHSSPLPYLSPSSKLCLVHFNTTYWVRGQKTSLHKEIYTIDQSSRSPPPEHYQPWLAWSEMYKADFSGVIIGSFHWAPDQFTLSEF